MACQSISAQKITGKMGFLKMRMKKLLSYLLLLLLLFSPACAEDATDGNLLFNASFSSVLEDGRPEGWFRALNAGVTTAFADVVQEDGAFCTLLQSRDDCFIRIKQSVEVEPSTLYCLSVQVKANLTLTEKAGAGLWVEESIEDFPAFTDTNGAWRTLTVYGKTGSKQNKLTFSLRLGAPDSLNQGSALFRDASLTKVSVLPSSASVLDLSGVSKGVLSAAGGAEIPDEPTRRTPAFIFLALAAALLAVFCFRRREALPENSSRYQRAFYVVLGAAMALRLALGALAPGSLSYMVNLTLWSETMADNGPRALSMIRELPPLMGLLLYPVALLKNILGFETGSAGHLMLLKLLPMAGDAALLLLLEREARKKLCRRDAFLLVCFFALVPAAFFASGVCGYTDCLTALCLALSLLCLANGKYQYALPAFTAGLLLCGGYVWLLAPGLLILLYPFLQKKRGAAYQGLLGLTLSAALFTLTAFCYSDSPFAFLSNYLSAGAYLTQDQLNLYCLLGRNLEWSVAEPVLMAVGMVLSTGACLFVLWADGRRDSHDLFLSGAALTALLAFFFPGMNERALWPAFVLLVFAFVYEKDKRILWSVLVMGITLFLNEVLVWQGGCIHVIYAHLHDAEAWLNLTLSAVNLLNAAFLCYVFLTPGRKKDIAPIEKSEAPAPLTPADKPDYRLRLRLPDYALMLCVAVLYGVLAFFNLGDTVAPQTFYTPEKEGEQAVFDLGETKDYYFLYYCGPSSGHFTVELSDDGENWTPCCFASSDSGDVFYWRWFMPVSEDNERLTYEKNDHFNEGVRYSSAEAYFPLQRSRYLRVTFQNVKIMLGEVAFLSADGETLPYACLSGGSDALSDEQSIVPKTCTYMNSAYFDEVYHARTAYEFKQGLTAYEWTHPPLGKVLIMLGMELFGVTPFGWRFMGTLFGVLMLPAMYLLVMQLTHKRKLALFSMLLFSVDFMHFVQTRIATVDSFAVLFIMLMTLFMARYAQMDWRRDGFSKSLVPLFLSGLMMGLACAVKWIGVYGGAGLALLFFWSLGKRMRENAIAPVRDPGFYKKLWGTLGACVIFFVLIPLCIYYFSYYWQLKPEGGLSIARVVELQKQMLSYHSGDRGVTHYYCSAWYQWPVIGWPMSFYSGGHFLDVDTVARITCMGNPVIWWLGLAAVLYGLIKTALQKKADARWLSVLIMYLAQLCPWLLITRGTFIYHYFACVPFLIVALALALSDLGARRAKAGKIAGCAVLGLSAAAFVLFYPILSGLPVAKTFAQILQWFSWSIV